MRKSKKWHSSNIGGPRAVQKNIGSAYFRAIYHDDQFTSRSGGATTDDVAACFSGLPTIAMIGEKCDVRANTMVAVTAGLLPLKTHG